ncbi:MAG: PAS domain S-box protein [Flavobacteriales bacterium]|nr:PAS domain S-box protein [Flavobacteriales bacterium]
MDRELNESEARYKGILHQSIEPIIFFDPSTRKIIEANKAFCKLIGIAQKESNALQLFDFIEGNRQEINMFIREVMISERGQVSNATWKKKSGQLVEVELSSTKVRLKGKDIVSIMARDVTVLKKIERLKEKERQEYFAAIVEAQEDERNRIACELHDSLGQMLSAASYKIENTLLSSVVILENKKLLKSTRNIQKILDTAIEEVRNISQDLMPMMLRDFGLGAALRHLCAQARDQGVLDISYRNYISDLRMEKKVERIVYRIAQEAINNVFKHSKAKKATLSIKNKDGKIILRVKDNGIGYDLLAKRKKRGMGLITMEERTKSLKGSLKCRSRVGEGTQVLMSFELEGR